jgi:hypothetical protein
VNAPSSSHMVGIPLAALKTDMVRTCQASISPTAVTSEPPTGYHVAVFDLIVAADRVSLSQYTATPELGMRQLVNAC